MKKLIILILLILLVGCQPRDISVVLNEGYDIIGVNDEWIDAGCTLNINADFAIDMEVSSNDIDLTTPGEYRVVYIEEYASVEYTCLRIVKVIDEEAPTVVLNPGIDTIKVFSEWVDAGVTATDNFDDDLVILVEGIVRNELVGSYEITYLVFDDAGNITELIRVVNVIE
jgi:hypothetical protein